MNQSAIRLLFRACVVVEALSTIIGAVSAFLAPELAIGSLISGQIVPQARAVMPQAGAAWLVLALMMLGTLRLRPGDERALRIILLPLLIGDVVHLAAAALLIREYGSWTGGAIGLAVFTLVLFTYRTLAALRPELLLGKRRA